MEIQYIVEENDYLQYQLYRASTLPKVKARRLREWMLTPIAFFCLAYLFYNSERKFLIYYFLILGVAAFIGMPFYTAWRYKRHYLNHVRDVLKNNFGKTATIKFLDEYIETYGDDGESKIKLSHITEINEIADYYFLQLASGQGLIIPKQKITNQKELAIKIKELVSQFNIKYHINLNWKWK